MSPATQDPKAVAGLERGLVALRGMPSEAAAFFTGAAYAAQVQLSSPTAPVRTAWADTLNGVIYIHPSYAASTERTVLATTIAHEVLHILRAEHDFVGGRDPGIWNIAADIQINMLLSKSGWSIPPQWVLPATLPSFGYDIPVAILDKWMCDDPSTAEVYDDLKQCREPEEPEEPEESGGGAPEHFGFDAEGRPVEASSHRGQTCSAAERIASMAERSCGGCVPAELSQFTMTGRKAVVSWRAQLASFVGARAQQDWSWARPHIPTFVSSGIVIPSVSSAPSVGHVLILMDTSGSVSDDTLGEFYSEIAAISDIAAEVTLCHFTSGVDKVERFDPANPPTERFYGGTDIPATLAELGRHPELREDYKVVIVFTDLYSPPVTRQQFGFMENSLLFITPKHHGSRPEVGRVVVMEKD